MTEPSSSTTLEPKPRGRRQAVVWGVAFGYTSVAFALLRNVLLVPLYLRAISLEEYGAWLASGGALVQLFISDFGLSGALTQRLAVLLGAKRWSEIGPALGAGIAASLLLGLALTAVGVTAAPFVPLFDSLTADSARRVMACFRISIAAGGLSILGASLVGGLRSLQNSMASGAAILASEVAGIVATVWLIFHGYGLYAIAVGLLLRSLLLACAAAAALQRDLARMSQVQVRFGGVQMRLLLGDSVYAFVASIAMKLQTQANTVIVAYLLGPAAAAIYGLTTRAHDTVLALLSQVTTALVPAMAHLYGSGNLARFRDVIQRMIPVLAATCTGALTIVVACNQGFVSLWVGPTRYGGDAVSILMAAAGFVSVIGYVAYDALLATGDFRRIARVFALTGAFHLAALCVLPRYGLWGAPLATLLSAALWSTVFWRRVRTTLAAVESTAASRSIYASVAGIVAAGALVIGVAIALPHVLVSGWAPLVGRGALCTGAVAMLMLVLSPRLRRLLAEEARSTVAGLR